MKARLIWFGLIDGAGGTTGNRRSFPTDAETRIPRPLATDHLGGRSDTQGRFGCARDAIRSRPVDPTIRCETGRDDPNFADAPCRRRQVQPLWMKGRSTFAKPNLSYIEPERSVVERSAVSFFVFAGEPLMVLCSCRCAQHGLYASSGCVGTGPFALPLAHRARFWLHALEHSGSAGFSEFSLGCAAWARGQPRSHPGRGCKGFASLPVFLLLCRCSTFHSPSWATTSRLAMVNPSRVGAVGLSTGARHCCLI